MLIQKCGGLASAIVVASLLQHTEALSQEYCAAKMAPIGYGLMEGNSALNMALVTGKLGPSLEEVRQNLVERSVRRHAIFGHSASYTLIDDWSTWNLVVTKDGVVTYNGYASAQIVNGAICPSGYRWKYGSFNGSQWHCGLEDSSFRKLPRIVDSLELDFPQRRVDEEIKV